MENEKCQCSETICKNEMIDLENRAMQIYTEGRELK